MINIGINNIDASWLIIELSKIIPAMGYKIIDKVKIYLDEFEEQERLDLLNPIIKGLVTLAIENINSKERVIDLLYSKLSDYQFNYDTYNSYLANALVKLKGVKSIDLIETVIKNDKIHYEEFDETGFESYTL